MLVIQGLIEIYSKYISLSSYDYLSEYSSNENSLTTKVPRTNLVMCYYSTLHNMTASAQKVEAPPYEHFGPDDKSDILILSDRVFDAYGVACYILYSSNPASEETIRTATTGKM